MTKKQKVWLGIFLAVFIVPEVLWNPVVNTLYSFFQSGKIIPQIFRNNFLLEYRYEYLFKLIITMQLIGIVLALFYVIKYKNNIRNLVFWPFVLICLLLAIITTFVFYLIVMFNPSFP